MIRTAYYTKMDFQTYETGVTGIEVEFEETDLPSLFKVNVSAGVYLELQCWNEPCVYRVMGQSKKWPFPVPEIQPIRRDPGQKTANADPRYPRDEDRSSAKSEGFRLSPDAVRAHLGFSEEIEARKEAFFSEEIARILRGEIGKVSDEAARKLEAWVAENEGYRLMHDHEGNVTGAIAAPVEVPPMIKIHVEFLASLLSSGRLSVSEFFGQAKKLADAHSKLSQEAQS